MRAAPRRCAAARSSSTRAQTLDFTPPWPRGLDPRRGEREAVGEDVSRPGPGAARAAVRRARPRRRGPAPGAGGLLDELFTRARPARARSSRRSSSTTRARSRRWRKRQARRTRAWSSASSCSCAGMELGNAFSEQNDPAEQAAPFEHADGAPRRAATTRRRCSTRTTCARSSTACRPPAGVGIGIDRLVDAAHRQRARSATSSCSRAAARGGARGRRRGRATRPTPRRRRRDRAPR